MKGVGARRGPKPKGKVRIQWSPNFAYAIGLIATDGCLSSDKRHIDFTSKETEQIENFLRALGISNLSVGRKTSGGHRRRRYLRVQIGDVLFYRFLISIGFTSAKSKTLGAISIPRQYFFDFLRGVWDGDGCFYSYWDSRWRSSFMFYTTIASASPAFIAWMQDEIHSRLRISGHITCGKNNSVMQLKYAKADSLKIIKKVYYSPTVLCLSRKRKKIFRVLTNRGLIK
ncbi:hypothetical protein A2841_00970 [Candidatus Kaiserbacteria bacterium RIFCSPHIGHO2_01_FULL_48_10]|uniref:DOD-type homing endonuclease domain-containing protein n=1 Tax=Candidatus Kaiserbacteria bacterium RIFCSPHIGHO2_01_FULL_48_10 TaxID=1798476 RepID=A0A1F6C5F5_9BACT|nr:MAG: hypothetical protein A2841_00970 [Candidatus Kaiserbacteria bacterium RIFCSPHIGHO2_01_FULL_48_10]